MKTLSLESAAYDQFLKTYFKEKESGYTKHLRLGQAFYHHFDLQKSTQYTDVFNVLWNLDGDAAQKKIQSIFEFN